MNHESLVKQDEAIGSANRLLQAAHRRVTFADGRTGTDRQKQLLMALREAGLAIGQISLAIELGEP